MQVGTKACCFAWLLIARGFLVCVCVCVCVCVYVGQLGLGQGVSFGPGLGFVLFHHHFGDLDCFFVLSILQTPHLNAHPDWNSQTLYV